MLITWMLKFAKVLGSANTHKGMTVGTQLLLKVGGSWYSRIFGKIIMLNETAGMALQHSQMSKFNRTFRLKKLVSSFPEHVGLSSLFETSLKDYFMA